MRGRGEVLMGKNSLMRRAIKEMVKNRPELDRLVNLIKQNVVFIMTNDDLKEIRDLILTFRVATSAKRGAISPVAVTIPAQVTTLPPEKTSFFGAQNIPTKISRGYIEIISSVRLLEVGDKVSESAAELLKKLEIRPFTYGFDIVKIFDSGAIFDPAILDITEDDIRFRFMNGVSNVASVSLAIGYPTVASVPHSIANAFRNVMAVAAVTDINFKQVAHMKVNFRINF